MGKGSNLETVKVENTHAILDVIYEYGPISRIEIANRLSLTPSAITLNVSPMIASGLLKEQSTAKTTEDGPVGRPRVLIDFKPDAFYVIGVDLGPYGSFACISDIRGKIIKEIDNPLCPSNYDEALEFLTSIINQLIDSSSIKRKKIAAICLGIPGFVDSKSGLIRYASILKWKNKTLGKDIEERVNIPCIIENNARCRALSAEMFSNEHLPDTYAFLYVARGIGCSIKVGNKAYRGAKDGAGEIGHMVMDHNGPSCPTCGNHGCLEAFSSEVTIKNNARLIVESGRETLLTTICENPMSPTIQEVMRAQEEGDKEVCYIMDNAIMNLGVAIANVINLLNPPLVMVDGFIFKSQYNKDLFYKKVKENLFAIDLNEVEIRFVEFKKYRTAYGAAAKAIKRFILKEVDL